MFINIHYLNGSDFDTPFWKMASESADMFNVDYQWNYILDFNPQFRKKMFEIFYKLLVYIEKIHVSLIMTKFLLPFAIKIIDAAVDKIPEDLEDKLKEFVIGLLKKGS